MKKGHCSTCGTAITLDNAAPSIVKRKSGYCRVCKNEHTRKWASTLKGKEAQRRYNIRANRSSSFVVILSRVLYTILRKLRKEEKTNARITKKLWAMADNREKEYSRKSELAFHNKIFQPRICIDCRSDFETLYPSGFIAGRINLKILGVVRCQVCRRARRQSTHGGDYRRCSRFGVPYDPSVNRLLVLERGGWTCYKCGRETPKKRRGTFEDNAPEIDHIHPLGAIIDGKKSPGHVQANVACICRRCNLEKNKEFEYRPKGSWNSFYKDGLLNKKKNGTWLTEPRKLLVEIICPVCGKQEVRNRLNAVYCSDLCAKKAKGRRKNIRNRKHTVPEIKICIDCGRSYKPVTFNQLRCSGCRVKHKRRLDNTRKAKARKISRMWCPKRPIGRPRKEANEPRIHRQSGGPAAISADRRGAA